MKKLWFSFGLSLWFCAVASAEVKPSYAVIKAFEGHQHDDADYLREEGAVPYFPNGFPPTLHNFSEGGGYSEYRKADEKQMKEILARLSDVSPYFGGQRFQPKGEKPLDAKATLAINIAEGAWTVERVREIKGTYLESTRALRDEGKIIVREIRASRPDPDFKSEQRTFVIREYYSVPK